jgi:hypothetical protein
LLILLNKRELYKTKIEKYNPLKEKLLNNKPLDNLDYELVAKMIY